MGGKQIEKQVGYRLKKLREDAHLTQEEAAKKIGISYSSLQKYEAGFVPSMKSIEKYEVYFKVDRAWILSKDDTRPIERGIVAQSEPEYRPYPRSEADKIILAITDLTQILRDADDVVGGAIMGNIAAFKTALELRKRIDNIRNEVQNILKRHSPPPGEPERREAFIELKKVIAM